jgi:hypothetical protein
LNAPFSDRGDIISDFTSIPYYVGVERIELAMFNCPEKGISIQTITILTASALSQVTSLYLGFSIIISSITSCEFLMKVHISEHYTISDIYAVLGLPGHTLLRWNSMTVAPCVHQMPPLLHPSQIPPPLLTIHYNQRPLHMNH